MARLMTGSILVHTTKLQGHPRLCSGGIEAFAHIWKLTSVWHLNCTEYCLSNAGVLFCVFEHNNKILSTIQNINCQLCWEFFDRFFLFAVESIVDQDKPCIHPGDIYKVQTVYY